MRLSRRDAFQVAAAAGFSALPINAVGHSERVKITRVELFKVIVPMQLLLSGIAGGVFGGTAVSRILQSQLHGVEHFDPWTLAVTCILLVTAGLFATWLPTRRVARTDPMTALRAE